MATKIYSNVGFTHEQFKKLKEVSKEERRSKAQIIELALDMYFKRIKGEKKLWMNKLKT